MGHEINSIEYQYLVGQGITVLETASNLDNDLVKEIFGTSSRVSKNLTRKYFPGKKMDGNWVRGGGESFYTVGAVSTGLFSRTKLVAMKAIASMGDGYSRTLTEASRQVALNRHAPEIYAIAPCVIIKEFLLEDQVKHNNEEEIWGELIQAMSNLGLWLAGSRIQSEAIISGGIAKLVDAGEDVSGNFLR